MTTVKPNRTYWIITTLGLLWNLMGVFAFLGQTFVSGDALSELPPEQVALIESTPQWLTGIFAIATLTGLLGSVFLLLRKSLAVSLFLISLVGVLIQMGYSFFATNALEVYGPVQGLIMPLIVIFIAFYLYFFSKRCSKQRILK